VLQHCCLAADAEAEAAAATCFCITRAAALKSNYTSVVICV
jgi:hypothetical protein